VRPFPVDNFIDGVPGPSHTLSQLLLGDASRPNLLRQVLPVRDSNIRVSIHISHQRIVSAIEYSRQTLVDKSITLPKILVIAPVAYHTPLVS
jgi:hypothetical protein